MPRKSRIDAPGALHHIVARGIERKKIFQDDTDQNHFLDRLGVIRVGKGSVQEIRNYFSMLGIGNQGKIGKFINSWTPFPFPVGVTTSIIARAAAHLEEEGRPSR